MNNILLPKKDFSYKNFVDTFTNQLNDLIQKYKSHPELYLASTKEGDDYYKDSKTLLDALFEEGIIPTFSFPKNVVSATVMDGDSGRIKYQVQRGLDLAINEYAPGRAIVVDKQTYQIGGLFDPNVLRYYKKAKEPAAAFINDENYLKQIVKCPNCEWFGLESDHNKQCPFCGKEELTNGMPILKPWGFGPLNGKSIAVAQLNEDYTMSQEPLYSTVPDKDEMQDINGYSKVRMAARYNQRIIMINPGNNGHGFKVCSSCGASLPVLGSNDNPIEKIDRPYLWKYAGKRCRHEETVVASLGYDFITDMLVMEFELDPALINTSRKNPWIDRAASSLAEALRLSASRLMDIEFTELNSGFRVRRNKQGAFVDVYLYDSLSSGAGYSVSITTQINELLNETEKLLEECDCDCACTKCLKHFRNQTLHSKLDRFSALELLRYGKTGKTAEKISVERQYQLVRPIIGILKQENVLITRTSESLLINDEIKLNIVPAMWKQDDKKNTVQISDIIAKYAKPLAYKTIMRTQENNN